jgi:hypothetical protein
MKIFRYLFLCIVLFISLSATAQVSPPPPPSPAEPAAPQGSGTWQDRPIMQPGIPIEPDSVRFWPQSDLYLDLTFGSFSRTYGASLSANRLYHILESRRLVLGYGARFNYYRANRDAYAAAPQRAQVNGTGDSIFVDGSTFYSLNFALQIRYRIFPRFDIGASTDIAGFTFGPRVTAEYTGINDPGLSAPLLARPTPYNLFLTGNRDRGMLNGELFLVYHMRRNIDIRGGYAQFTTEYTTDVPLGNNNDRFRNRSGMVFIGISYLPFY